MKQWLIVLGFLLAIMTPLSSAQASILEWPVISQVSNVVQCIISDAGTISTSLITHASGFAIETLSTVGKCLLYIEHQVTPGLISEPPNHS